MGWSTYCTLFLLPTYPDFSFGFFGGLFWYAPAQLIEPAVSDAQKQITPVIQKLSTHPKLKLHVISFFPRPGDADGGHPRGAGGASRAGRCCGREGGHRCEEDQSALLWCRYVACARYDTQHGSLRLLVRHGCKYSVGCSLRGGAMVVKECPPSVHDECEKHLSHPASRCAILWVSSLATVAAPPSLRFLLSFSAPWCSPLLLFFVSLSLRVFALV